MAIGFDDLERRPGFFVTRKPERVTFLPEPERRPRWCTLISVDDHLVEPPHLFESRLPARLQAAAHGGRTSFESGMPVLMFWVALLVFGAACFALAGLTVRALQIGELPGAAIVGGFLALFLWQIGTFLKRNRPARYRPEELPPEVLP